MISAIIVPLSIGVGVALVVWFAYLKSSHSGTRKDFKHLAEVESALKKEYDALYNVEISKAKAKFTEELAGLKHKYSQPIKGENGCQGEFVRSGLESIGIWCKSALAVGAEFDGQEFEKQAEKLELLKAVMEVYFKDDAEAYNSFTKIVDEVRSLMLQVFGSVKDVHTDT